jgi:8-oxo-dGTP pyrophosphatase MutT (NUDIX family)
MIVSRREVLAVVEAFDAASDARATHDARRTADLLRTTRDPFARTTYEPGHITASAVVLDSTRQHVLLAYHERLGRWLQPGGHIEPHDTSIVNAAFREVQEETGVVVSEHDRLELVSIEVHEIPPAMGEPGHLHHDLMFHGVASASSPSSGTAKALWCLVTDIGQRGVDGALRRAIARAIALHRLRT